MGAEGKLLLAVLILVVGLVVFVGIPMVIIGVVEWIKEPSKERRRRQDDETKAAEEAVRLRSFREEQQRGYRDQMAVLAIDTMRVFESVPKHLSVAEEHLDQAEVDFADEAFAPFWDSIEKAARELGRFDESVRRINQDSSIYTDLIKKYEHSSPGFPLSPLAVEGLRVATATADRMKAVVRKAQRNFQFSMIYEQRKTNKILVAGFTNLVQALDRMTWQMTESIDNLGSSFQAMGSTFSESMRSIHSRLGDIADTSREQLRQSSKGASGQSERERKVLAMLDNIQRGRRPFL